MIATVFQSGAFNFAVSAAVSSGTTGDCTWTLNGTTLTISGSGKMKDYDYYDPTPWGTDVTKVNIQSGVTYIGRYAFAYCDGIVNLTIPNSVTSIGSYAFYDCEGMLTLTIPDTVTELGYYAFENVYLNKLIISDGSKTVTSTIIIGDPENVVVPNSVTKIGAKAFCYGSLKNITLGNSVETIEDSAFYGCNNLKSITLPESLTSIGSEAFAGCPLGKIVIPKNVETIGDSAFWMCYSLTSVTLPEKLKTIGANAFNRCGIENITIPSSVETIGNSAFCHCENLKNITIPDSVTSMGNSVFNWCTALKNAVIGKNVKKIDDGDFYFCESLTNITLKGAELVKGNSFQYCKNLKRIYFSKDISVIYNNAFSDCNNITDIYYEGSKSDWQNVTIQHSNGSLSTATVHYNSSGIPECAINGYHDTTLINKKSATCTSKGYTGDIKCNDCGKIIKKGKTTPAAHKNTTKVTKAATLSSNGKSVTTCSKCNKLISNNTIPKISNIKLSTTAYTYNGKTKTPSVTVKDSKGKTLTKNKDYTVTYSSGRKNVGKYSAKITLKGSYSGTKTLYFTINPKGTTLKSISAGKKKLSLKLNKQSSQVTGYEIQYSTSKSFKSAKTKTVNSYKTTSVTIKSLKAKNTYYVRVRTYKTVNGKKYYSSWSSAKSKKTK